MPRRIVTVHYDRCNPGTCDGGVCAAALACPRKLLVQEEAYQIPLPTPASCPDCAKCVLACPRKAIELV